MISKEKIGKSAWAWSQPKIFLRIWCILSSCTIFLATKADSERIDEKSKLLHPPAPYLSIIFSHKVSSNSKYSIHFSLLHKENFSFCYLLPFQIWIYILQQRTSFLHLQMYQILVYFEFKLIHENFQGEMDDRSGFPVTFKFCDKFYSQWGSGEPFAVALWGDERALWPHGTNSIKALSSKALTYVYVTHIILHLVLHEYLSTLQLTISHFLFNVHGMLLGTTHTTQFGARCTPYGTLQ